MKRSILSALAIIAAFAFTTCDKVDLPNQGNTGGGGGVTDTNDVAVQRVVLEDYTGQGCGNCPGAAVVARQLLQAYPDELIVITVHAGYFADTAMSGGNPYPTSFSTPAGEDYNTEWTIDLLGNPKGMINRTEYQGNTALGKDNWSPAVADIIGSTPTADVDIETNFNSGNGEVTVEVDYEFLDDLQGNYNLLVMVTETDIYDWQKNYANTGDPQYAVGDITDYKHEHILRDNLNGPWGDPIVTGNVTSGTTGSQSFTYTLGSTWVPEKCHIIAMITNTDTKQIVNAEEVYVTQ